MPRPLTASRSLFYACSPYRYRNVYSDLVHKDLSKHSTDTGVQQERDIFQCVVTMRPEILGLYIQVLQKDIACELPVQMRVRFEKIFQIISYIYNDFLPFLSVLTTKAKVKKNNYSSYIVFYPCKPCLIMISMRTTQPGKQQQAVRADAEERYE